MMNRLVMMMFTLMVVAQGQDDVFIDPYDMVNPVQQRSKTTEKVEETAKHESKQKPEVINNQPKDMPNKPKELDPAIQKSETKVQNNVCTKQDIGKRLFINFVKKFIAKFDGKVPASGSQEYNLLVKLSLDDYQTLQHFVSDKGSPGDDVHHMHDANEILTSMIQTVSKSHIGKMGKVSIWFEETFGASIDITLKILAILVLASVFLTLELRMQLSWRRRFTQLIVLAFLVSIPMTWVELYKAEQIKQQTVTMKDAPSDCVQRESLDDDWFGAATSMLSSLFTFKDDKCQKYYEHMLIDPFLKVPPTKAVGITFVRFFVSPLKDIGASLSVFIRELLVDLPVTLYPVAMAMVSIFLFLILFMWFGYSIRLPLFMSIEPTPYLAVASSSSNQEAIEANTNRLLEQLKSVQDNMQAREEAMNDRLSTMERLQRSAIEFTAAAATISTGPSPTLPPAILQKPHLSPTMTVEYDSTQRIYHESGQGDTSFESSFESTPVGDNLDIKSPIPCSEAELESSTEDSTQVKETSDHIREVPRNHSSKTPSPQQLRSSKLPVKKVQSKDSVPTEVSTNQKSGIPPAEQLQNLSQVPPATIISSETQRSSSFINM